MLALVLVSARNFKILFLKENSQGVRSRFWQMWLESFLVKGRHKPLLLLFFFFFRLKKAKRKRGWRKDYWRSCSKCSWIQILFTTALPMT